MSVYTIFNSQSDIIDSLNQKKVLFIIGMEEALEQWLYSATHLPPEKMLVLVSHGPLISEPFDSLMRSVIIAVAQENVEEIFVIGAINNNEFELVEKDLISIVNNGKVPLANKDYLSEFKENDIFQWLKGSETVTDSIKKSMDFIRQHPLMPSGVKVYGLSVDTVSGKLSSVVEYE
ncbi:carbonic anhydrase [Thermoflavimicrobium daqui]|uniref:Carbonic anhydrase n=1 Tax=Thermoflavimicrobium daqui TaxID=2137476 RepID=A0A364K7I3_9BACL|nr:carbonic anhydrase [Thermoflavimicrobium daqui]RAL26244.1 carbonic anhydrase [Thermoflavimicrobium daqui]